MTDKTKAPKSESEKINSISKSYQTNLLNANRFVCYDENKIPYNAQTKLKANCLDESNWRSFNFVSKSIKYNPKFKGIGFVLGYDAKKQINYCGLDIDNCISEQGIISQKALNIINLLDTYTEISKSGRGIHCIFIANKKGSKCKNNNLDFCKCLEIYDKNRYFALTGNIINNKDIEYRQKECDFIYDKFFQEKQDIKCDKNISLNNIRYSDYGENYLDYILKKDKKFKDYWYRNIVINDESSSDITFIIKLAYWLNSNFSLIKQWFLSSPYYMGKDEKHMQKTNRKDYLDRTIQNAINYQKQRGK